MNKNFSLIIIIINLAFMANAQVAVEKSDSDLELFQSIPSESIYLHSNASIFLVGEYIYYSVYNLSKEQEAFSDLSIIAFVELVDSSGKKVFEQTIELENGRGVGDYFIPTNVTSGNYKLVAYTSWMKNNENQTYFDQNLVIINPYQSNQNQIQPESIEDSLTGMQSLSINTSNKKINSKQLQLRINKQEFNTRDKVEIDLLNVDERNEIDYSISVRKVDNLDQPDLNSAVEYYENSFQKVRISDFTNLDSITLPDLRGQLLKGKISPVNEIDRSNLNNTKVALSISGDPFYLRIANTDADGIFYFNIDQNFTTETADIQILDSEFTDYNLKLYKGNSTNYDPSSFSDFQIDPSMKSVILERSVHNQIENAFYAQKPDTIKTLEKSNLFDEIEMVEYPLDNYTRFKTIRETFIEVVEYARIRKSADGKFELGVLGYKPYENYDGSPLFIVDGLLIQDATDFIESYDSRKIDKIKVIRDQYFLGSKSYKGVVIIETFEGDYVENYQPDNIKKVQLKNIESSKNYFKQLYGQSSQNFENIPDYRYQLLWEPQKLLKSSSEKLEFFTSDVTGTFEIVIQGFSKESKPVSIKRIFTVK